MNDLEVLDDTAKKPIPVSSVNQWIRYWLLTARDEAIMGIDPERAPHASVALSEAAASHNALAIRQNLFRAWKRSHSRDKTDWSTKPIPILFAPFIFRYPHERQQRSGRWPAQVIPLWVPGQIDPEGQWLLPAEDPGSGQRIKPWVVRDYLEPLTDESVLVLGSMSEVDRKLTNWAWPPSPRDWTTYLEAAAALMPDGWVDRLEELNYQGPNNLFCSSAFQGFVIWDDSVHGTMHGITSVYEHLLEHPDQASGVLRHFAEVTPTPIRQLSPSAYGEQVKTHHVGHINQDSKRPLNEAQRLALIHALSLSAGELMALNGPPGTGKTTWVHGFWSSLWTRAAIAEDDIPPIIVVASTNNQAVGNVLDSLNRDIAAERWLPDIPAQFGLLIKTKDDERMPPGTWRASWNGGGFDSPFKDWSTVTFLDRAESAYRQHMSAVLPRASDAEECSLADIVALWHDHLLELVDRYKIEASLWLQYERFAAVFKNKNELDIVLKPFLAQRQQALDIRKRWHDNHQDWETLRHRMHPWDRLAARLNRSRWLIEWQDLARNHRWSFDGPWTEGAIDTWLRQQESQAQAAVDDAQDAYDNIMHDWNAYQSAADRLTTVMHGSPAQDWTKWADTHCRYPMFIAALHYWEGRWLLAVRRQLTNRPTTRSGSAVDHRMCWGTLAMLAPCFVTTLHSGPAQFTRWNSGAQRAEPLTHLIDWLVLDESGQIAPYLPGGLLAMAQRAVIVGDVHQLQPVSTISEVVDRGNAQAAGLALNESVYRQLRPYHVWASNGQDAFMASAMGRAQQRTVWSESVREPDQRGITLVDHHRCVEQIISFCNELVYQNRIQPKRKHHAHEPHPWPTWGYASIWGHAEKSGGSWINVIEAQTIAQWLVNERSAIEAHYEQPLAASVAIVTPFKAQGETIRHALVHNDLLSPEQQNDWKIGTVHGIQGAERPLVIFSPVYTVGVPVSTFFFDRSAEMLNVAVSRAKDSFWVFGDFNIFDHDSTRPSGVLARFLDAYGEEIPITPVRVEPGRSLIRLDTLEAHRAWLAQQWQKVQKRIVIISPFLSPSAIVADRMTDAIQQACSRGVSVGVYHDRQWVEKHPQVGEAVSLLQQAGAEVVDLPQIRANIVIVDGIVIAEGSFNWLSADRTQSDSMQWNTTLVYDRSANAVLMSSWIKDIQERIETLKRIPPGRAH